MLGRAFVAFVLIALPSLVSAQDRRPLDHEAYDGWRTVEGRQISANGQWITYSLTPQRGDAELHATSADGNTDYVVPRGTAPRFAGNDQFVVFTIKPVLDSVSSAKRRKADRDEMPRDSMGILDLSDGTVTRIAEVKSFDVAVAGGAFVAFLANDSTLTVRRLGDDGEYAFGNVTEYTMSYRGSAVAFIRMGQDDDRGAWLLDLTNGNTRELATGAGEYKSIATDRDGRQAAFLSTRDDPEADQKTFSLYYSGQSGPARPVANAGPDGIPDGWWVSEHRAPSFSRSGERVLFGTAPQPAPAVVDSTPEDERVKVDIWNWRDPLLQPMQLIQANRERQRSYLAVYSPQNDQITQLATQTVPEVSIGSGNDALVALGQSNLPYRQEISWDSPRYNDFFAIDVATGEARDVQRRVQGSLQLSPDGAYAAWWDNVQLAWFTKRLSDGTVANVTGSLGVAFHNEEHDAPSRPGAYGIAGWTEANELVLYDRFDLWAVDADGFGARNVTNGAGRADSVRFRYLRLDPEADRVPNSMVLSVFNFDSKAAGFAHADVRQSRAPHVAVTADFRFGQPVKARNTNTVMFTRESVDEYPDLWAADVSFSSMTKISEANPQQSEYKWATVEQFSWRSVSGEPLRGLVYKPEDFDPSRKYPTIVYFYERNSNGLHAHHPPIPHRSVIRPTFYASRGYVVFIPDITYDIGYPGQSAMDDIIPGVLELIRQGYVDENNLGMQGHSWGGYQIAYMVTKTNLFKAAAGGAPVSNMTSAYGGIRWATGMSRMFQYERTQSRLGGTLWETPIRYIENSPIFWADKVETPLLMMHNDHDGAVPWEQGIEMFVALRRLGKPAWLVNYNDEPHWPTTYPNKVDWNIRMQQFFDHYLKGDAAPRWLAEGIPATEKGNTLGYESVGPHVPMSGNGN